MRQKMTNHVNFSLKRIQELAAISSAAKIAKIKISKKKDDLQKKINADIITSSNKSANEIVKLVNSQVTLIPNSPKKTPCSLEHFITSKMPQNCVYLLQRNFDYDYSLCIIQEPPCKRTIQGENKAASKRKNGFNRKHYTIQLPYMNYIFSYTTKENKLFPHIMGIGFSQKPFTSLKDVIFDCSLPHSSLHHVCMPLPQKYAYGYNNLDELAKAYISNFWNSAFVYTFTKENCFTLKKNPTQKIDSFQDWQENVTTLDDILTAEYTHSPKTFNLVIQDRINSREDTDPSKDFKMKVVKNVFTKQNDIAKIICNNANGLIQNSLKE